MDSCPVFVFDFRFLLSVGVIAEVVEFELQFACEEEWEGLFLGERGRERERDGERVREGEKEGERENDGKRERER